MPEHRLIEFESDFLEEGSVAVCSCGWKSSRSRDDSESMLRFREHEHEAAKQARA